MTSFDLTRKEAIDKAERLVVDHRYDEALALLEIAVGRFPQEPELRLLFGTVLADLRPDEAAGELAEAIRLDVDDPVRLTRAARILLTLGYVDAASSYIARAVDLTPDGFAFEAELMNVSGLIATIRRDDEFAEEALREAVALDSTNEFFVRDLARFLAHHGKRAAALDVIGRAIPQVRDPSLLARLRSELPQ